MWRRYRDSVESRLPQTEPITGEDANLAAAFLAGSLSKKELTAFESRLAQSPGLLDAVLAARGQTDAEVAPAVPEAVVTWAKNLHQDGGPARRARRSPARRSRIGLRLPLFAALSTSVALCAVLVFSFVYIDDAAPPKTAAAGKSKAIEAREKVQVTTDQDTDLDDSENSFFFKWDPD